MLAPSSSGSVSCFGALWRPWLQYCALVNVLCQFAKLVAYVCFTTQRSYNYLLWLVQNLELQSGLIWYKFVYELPFQLLMNVEIYQMSCLIRPLSFTQACFKMSGWITPDHVGNWGCHWVFRTFVASRPNTSDCSDVEQRPSMYTRIRQRVSRRQMLMQWLTWIMGRIRLMRPLNPLLLWGDLWAYFK